ncbi:hypothetical protein LZC95_20390 [Pendulispora brunnea]|uniref:Uncharacterized protein n=1 Tax=Pendulispora brunnea TaxID=2905690 RepID=A0ABZ2KM97_9BACT
MDIIDSMVERLKRARHPVRVALAAAVGDRVLPVFEEYWREPPADEIPRTLELVWAHACGEAVDKGEFAACVQEVEETVEFLEGEQVTVATEAAVVIQRAAEATNSDEGEAVLAVARALVMALDAAEFAEGMANRQTPNARTEAALAEEKAWQDAALVLIVGWRGVPNRRMFDSIGSRPPKWLKDWSARIAHLT